jgi:hypothetical protein
LLTDLCMGGLGAGEFQFGNLTRRSTGESLGDSALDFAIIPSDYHGLD